MAITYNYTKKGTTVTISVFDGADQIYTKSITTQTTPKTKLLQGAKAALLKKYPGVASMVQQNSTPGRLKFDPPELIKSSDVAPPPGIVTIKALPAPFLSPIASPKKPAGKGIEAVVTNIANQIAIIEKGIDDVYYGNKANLAKGKGIKIPGTTEKINGILPIVKEINNVDFCNILSMVVSKAAATDLGKVIGDESLVGAKLNKLKALSNKASKAIDPGRITQELTKLASKKAGTDQPADIQKLPLLPLTSKADYDTDGKLTSVTTELTSTPITYKSDSSIEYPRLDFVSPTLKTYTTTRLPSMKPTNETLIDEIITNHTEYINLQNSLRRKIVSLAEVSTGVSNSPTPATDDFLKSLDELTSTIDSDAVSIIPQLANSKNYLDDVKGSLSQYTNPNTIPSGGIQKVLGKIRGVQSTLDSISSINSIQDVLDLASKATGINLGTQIQSLQKKINIAQIIPAIRYVSRLLKAINQTALKLAGYVRILQTVATTLQTLLNVLGIIVKVLKAIPIPLMFVTSSVTQTLSSALQRIERFLEATTKRISQVVTVVDLVYKFIIGVSAKISELISLLDILIYNLQTCEIISDPKKGTNPDLVKDLIDTKKGLEATQSTLDAYTAEYAIAKADTTGKQRTYNGYVLKILEEEVVDNGIKYKRRRGVATDSKGVLIAETQLTFATDQEVIYEELKLLLKSKSPGEFKLDTGPVVGVSDILNIPAEQSDNEIYQSIGLTNQQSLNQTSVEVNQEISNFIGSIKKGGKKFQKTTRQNLAKFATENAQQLKIDAKAGKVPTTRNPFR